MPAHNGVNLGMLLCKLEYPETAIKVGSDADQSRDSRLLSPKEDLLKIGLKIRIIQVRMGVVKLGHIPFDPVKPANFNKKKDFPLISGRNDAIEISSQFYY